MRIFIIVVSNCWSAEPSSTPQTRCIGMDDLPKIVFPFLSSIFYSFLEKNHNISYKMDCAEPRPEKVLDGGES